MTHKDRLHTLELNKYLDRELAPADQKRIERLLQTHPAMKKRLAEMRQTRALFRQAFQDTQGESSREARPRRRSLYIKALAAGLLLTLGVTIGWMLHPADSARYPTASLAYVPEGVIAIHPVRVKAAADGPARTIFHISSPDPKKIRDALDKAEGLLQYYAEAGRPLQLEIIANAGGLNLLRADVSPDRARVQAMQRKYSNLSFLACRKTLQRLKLEHGIDAPLLPEVLVVPSALDEIVNRLEKGWSYIQA